MPQAIPLRAIERDPLTHPVFIAVIFCVLIGFCGGAAATLLLK